MAPASLLRLNWVRFGAAVAAISGPTALGSIISFASTPLLAYWFPPEQFGELGFALAFASILSSIVSLRMELLVFREKPERARELAAQAVVVVLVIATAIFAAIAVAAAIFPLKHLFFGDFSPKEVIAAAYLLTLTICIANIGSAMCVAQRRYLASSVPRTVGAIATIALAAALYLSNVADETGGGLLAANVLAQLLAAACYLALIGRTALLGVRIDALRALLRRNRDYIVFAAPQNSVAIAAFLNSAIILVGHFYGAAAAGHLFLAFRIVGFPSTVLGGAVANIFSNEAETITPRWLARRTLLMLVAGLAIYLPLGVTGILVPEHLVPDEWHGMLEMIAPVSLLCAMQFISGSFGQLLLIWNRAGVLLSWDSARLAFTCCVLLLAWSAAATANGAIWWFVIAQAPFYVALVVLIRAAAASRARRATPGLDTALAGTS